MVLSVMIPVYNEVTTIHEILRRARRGSAGEGDSSSSTTARRTAPATSSRIWSGRPTCVVLPRAEPGKGAALRTGLRRGDRRHRDRPGRRPRVRPDRVPEADRSRSSRARPTSSTARASSAATAPRAVLLALRRQPVPDAAVQHVHQPEPHRHGDLLQGLPPRDHPGRSRSRSDRFGFEPEMTAKIASAAAAASTRCGISLLRPHLRRRQEDRLEGRRPGDLVHREVPDQEVSRLRDTPPLHPWHTGDACAALYLFPDQR